MQVENPRDGVYLMPVVWYFAPEGAKTYMGVTAFTAGVWDRDIPSLPPQLGEQPPYAFPYYSGENVWGYRGICTIGSAEAFATGLTADDLAAPVQPFPECCTPKQPQMPVGIEVDFRLLSPGTQVVFNTPGPASWTAPPGVTYAMVETWGAGSVGSPGIGFADGIGGGGGAYARSILSVIPGQVYPITIGDGTLGPPKANGQTTFDSPVRVLADCAGHATGLLISLGGKASLSTGQVRFNGGNAGNNGLSAGGGGGASAGPVAAGASTLPPVAHQPGYPAGVDAGQGGDGQSGIIPPTNGATPGGGGGGGLHQEGLGAPGQVRISY
jgi:hypothetical protein